MRVLIVVAALALSAGHALAQTSATPPPVNAMKPLTPQGPLAGMPPTVNPEVKPLTPQGPLAAVTPANPTVKPLTPQGPLAETPPADPNARTIVAPAPARRTAKK